MTSPIEPETQDHVADALAAHQRMVDELSPEERARYLAALPAAPAPTPPPVNVVVTSTAAASASAKTTAKPGGCFAVVVVLIIIGAIAGACAHSNSTPSYNTPSCSVTNINWPNC